MALLFQLTQKLALGFQAFWVRWPRKVAKLEAQKAWNKVVTPEDEDAIHAALDWQIPIFERRDPEHRPHAATWIRGRRWEDEKPTTTPNRVIEKPPAKTLVPMAVQQQEASRKIRLLIDAGIDPDHAKQQVYREMGWIK